MPDELTQQEIAKLKKRVGTLEEDFEMPQDTTSIQTFNKFADFRDALKIPNRGATPATCRIGQVVEVAGTFYGCTVADTWTAFGGSGTKSVTFIVGPSSNSDSSGYDYVTDGTDDDVQIQTAIDDLPSTGGRIIFREGTYTFGTTVTIAKNGVTLQGQGKGTIFASTFTTIPLFNLGDSTVQYSNCVFTDIYFNTNITDSTSYDIDNGASLVVAMDYLLVKNCFFNRATPGTVIFSDGKYITIVNNFFTDAKILAQVGVSVVISNNHWVMTSTTLRCLSATGPGNIVSENIFSLPNSYNTIVLSSSSNGTVSNNVIIFGDSPGASAVGISSGGTLGAGGGAGGIFGNIIDCGDTANVASIGINTTDFSIISNNRITEMGIGISVGTGSYLLITNNHISETRADGIKLFSSDRVSVIGNSVTNAGRATNDTYSSIKLSNNSLGNIISGNICSYTTGNGPKYHIEVGATDAPVIVIGNIAIGAITSQISVANLYVDVSHNITE